MDLAQLRNFKDFLLLYNQISDTCFRRCANTFNSREIAPDEESCLNNCAQKHINANHRIMEVYMEVQPLMVQKRIEEINAAQVLLEEQQKKQQEQQETAEITDTSQSLQRNQVAS